MLLEDTSIYPIIKEYPELCNLHLFKRNEYITRPQWDVESVWYIVSGRVKVEATKAKGQKIFVDIIEEDNYICQLSTFNGKDFLCDNTADKKKFLYDTIVMESSSLIRIPIERFNFLMNTQNFNQHFYMKSHARLYEMYRKGIMRILFTQRQQFAFYLIENTKKDICKIHSLYFIGEYLKISRRNLYNILSQFISEGILVRLENGNIRVLDNEKLQKIAQPALDFYYTNKQ